MHRFLGGCALVFGSGAGIVLLLLFLHHDSAPNREPKHFDLAPVESGLSYTNQQVARVPWSIHVLRIDRSRTNFFMYSSHAGRTVLGVSVIADQARAVPPELGRAVAGINGDFYLRDDPFYAGDPRGLQIVRGELLSGPDTACVWFDTNGSPHLDEVKAQFQVSWPDGSKVPFGLNERRSPGAAVLYTPTYSSSTRTSRGRELVLEKDGEGPWLPLQPSRQYRARVRQVLTEGNARLAAGTMVLSVGPRLDRRLPETTLGTILEISTATTPDLSGVQSAIGGGPELIKDGKPFALQRPPPGSSDGFSERSKYERHPRSAIGWNDRYIFLVVVDGRQPGLSVGMKLAELSQYFLRLGCTEAMNFDGGKSAQLWVDGQIVNSPCQGEDTVASSLLVIQRGNGR